MWEEDEDFDSFEDDHDFGPSDDSLAEFSDFEEEPFDDEDDDMDEEDFEDEDDFYDDEDE